MPIPLKLLARKIPHLDPRRGCRDLVYSSDDRAPEGDDSLSLEEVVEAEDGLSESGGALAWYCRERAGGDRDPGSESHWEEELRGWKRGGLALSNMHLHFWRMRTRGGRKLRFELEQIRRRSMELT